MPVVTTVPCPCKFTTRNSRGNEMTEKVTITYYALVIWDDEKHTGKVVWPKVPKTLKKRKGKG